MKSGQAPSKGHGPAVPGQRSETTPASHEKAPGALWWAFTLRSPRDGAAGPAAAPSPSSAPDGPKPAADPALPAAAKPAPCLPAAAGTSEPGEPGDAGEAAGGGRARLGRSLASLFTARMGLSSSAVTVREDDEAKRRTRASGTRAVADRGVVHLDPDRFDPGTRDGAALLGHEIAHVAQSRIAGPARAYGEAEEEARAIGSALAAGGSPARPRVPFHAEAAEDPSAKQPEHTLPEGQDVGFLSSGTIVIRTSWWLEGVTIEREGGKSKKVTMKNPAKFEALLRIMKAAGYYFWMTEDQIQLIAKEFSIQGTELDPDEKFFTMAWGKTVHIVIGPQPGADFRFMRAGDGIRVVLRSSRVGPPPASGSAKMKLSKELKTQLVEALDQYTGVVSDAKGRANFVDVEQEAFVNEAPNAGSLILLGKETLDAIYQPERYKLFLDKKSPDVEQPKPVQKLTTGGGTTITYDAEVSTADKEYAGKWLETARGAPSTWGTSGPQIAGKTYYKFEIDLMREIDKNPNKAEILSKLRSIGGEIDSFAMRRAIDAAEYEISAKALGLTPTPTGGQRVFPNKVEGDIIIEGLAYPGRTNRIWFRKSNSQVAFLFQTVKTQWVVERQKDDKSWERIPPQAQTYEWNAREPDYFNFAFPSVGLYKVHAFVDHSWFYPGHFVEPMEVKTEEQRIGEVATQAFAGMGDATTTKDKDFDTSLFNEVFGSQRMDKGKEVWGTLPADFARMKDDDRVKFIATDKENLAKLIKKYDVEGASYAHRQIADYAKARLQSLKEQEAKIGAQKTEGYVFFEARGAYLSRTEGVADAPLKLLGMSKGDPDKVQIRIHDFTRLFEPEDFTFEAEGKDFDKAAEEAFLKICKRYPKGRMSVRFERMNNGNLSYKQIGVTPNVLGFELDTNTAWKAVRSVVWDPTVQIVVNLAGAALMIFAPPTAAIVLPVLAVYNSIETVSKMAELQESGNLTWGAFAKGVAEIGLNVLPVIAEFKALSIAARTASAGSKAVTTADKVVLYGLHGATVGGMLVLMTAEGVAQCRKLQEQDVSEVARILAKLEDVRDRNPNSTEIPALEAALKKASDNALNRAQEVFTNMAKSLAMILVPTAAMSKVAKAMVGKSVSVLVNEGKFIHQEGIRPHYDPVEGVMKGDKTKVTAEILDGLKAEFAADQGLKQIQLEKMAGTDKVEIQYSKDAKSVTVTKDAQTGVSTIVAPEGTPFEKVVKDAWDNHFSKQVGAPSEMPVLPVAELQATTKGSVIASKAGVQVGRRIETLQEGQELLRKLADGDQSAFSQLGAEAPGKTFDTQSVEWGLGQTADGKYVIVRGEPTHVDWSKTGLKPIAHTHPMAQSKLLKGNNVTFADLVKGAGENAVNADKVMPSPADIKFMVDNGLTRHTVETAYVSKGKGVVGNPTQGVVEPKITIEIVAPERVGLYKGMSDVPVYKAKLRAKAGGEVVWEADVWATHSPEAGSNLMFQEPSSSVMTKPKPGAIGTVAGGGTTFSGAHGFSPTSDVQTRALNDWNKLQESKTKYSGKFTWEDWLYRYEKEGLTYDVEGSRKWKTAEGKVKEVELFSADARAADVVTRLTTEGAGATGATSTFKPFFETLVRRGLVKDAAELEALIEKQFSFKDRSVDFVRHKLKEHYKPQLMDQASPKRWSEARTTAMETKHSDLPWKTDPAKAREAAGHREMTDVVKDLDSADKGPMMEQWLQENVYTDAKAQVAATKDEVDKQLDPGQTLGDNRKLDLLSGEEAIESKTVNDKLPASEASLDSSRSPTSQLLDYLRMIKKAVTITHKGQPVTLKKLKYVFTTTKGAVANIDMMKAVLAMPEFQGKVTFDVFDAKGARFTLTTMNDLAKPELAWLLAGTKK